MKAATKGRPPQLTSTERGTYRDDHGTPAHVIELHRRIHCTIDIDLASDAQAQKIVRARRYYSLEKPCPLVVTLPPDPGTVWCNPPGPSENVIRFWQIWCSCVARGAEGSFLAFSVDHLRFLVPPPTRCYVLFFEKRLKFVGNRSQAAIASAFVSTRPPKTEVDINELGPWLEWVE